MGLNDFNLDLTLIEQRLKAAGLHVEGALEMPVLVDRPLLQDTVFVLPLEDQGEEPDEIGGPDIQQYSPEQFGVVLGLRSPGDATGASSTAAFVALRQKVKAALVGLIIGEFEPIHFVGGRIVTVNKQTQNVLYQLQFQTAHNVVTEVQNYGD
ncbi:phage tail terminator protein [Bowmanella dokdonensis]|uniref:Uncharacterized protein n=1 Tax=Bowmanella dokdonensis TaxID=751969 RepID=A0A939IQN8_9ALTE|nr:hypothetical protein [Bowmanella dokdonensis]MBN7824777.1 hypothetical protein [Bowmanella dokdonensis]